MTRTVFLTLLALGLACAGENPDPEPGEVPAGIPEASREPALDAESACDSLLVLGSRTLAIELRRAAETEVEVPFVDPARGRRAGCRIIGADPSDRAPDPVGALYDALQASGWSPIVRFQADGPDGSLVGFSRDGVACLVRGKWDGGDDSDSTYVPEPGYEVELLCFLFVAADTLTY